MDCRLKTHHQLPENKKNREGYEFCFKQLFNYRTLLSAGQESFCIENLF